MLVFMKVFQVPVVGDNLEAVVGSLQPVSPLLQGELKRQELSFLE